MMNAKVRSLDYLLAGSLVATQFYLFESGLPQPAHILLLLYLVWMVASLRARFLVSDGLRLYRPAAIFVGYATILNLIFALIYQSYAFLMPGIYYLYGLSVAVFITMRLDAHVGSPLLVAKAAVVGLLLLLVIYFLGLGRFSFAPRYNGFFNDPNQMAFWVLCSFAIFALLSKSTYSMLLVSLLAVFLILLTMSRSGAIGILFALAGTFVNMIGKKSGSSKKRLLAFALIPIGVACIALYVSAVDQNEQMSSVVARFNEADVDQQADERGYGRILEYPAYLLFGAGQGNEERFNTSNEIHSTWAGGIFYYGFIGFAPFIIFIASLLFRLRFSQKLIFLGPLFYGFFTFGLRAPIFWMLVAVVVHVASKTNKS